MATRPSTPFYYFNGNSSADDEAIDPPPSYSSNTSSVGDGDGLSSLGSPRGENDEMMDNDDTVIDISNALGGGGGGGAGGRSSTSSTSRSSLSASLVSSVAGSSSSASAPDNADLLVDLESVRRRTRDLLFGSGANAQSAGVSEAETTAVPRSLLARFGGGAAGAGGAGSATGINSISSSDDCVFGSRLSSRAASPAPGQHSSQSALQHPLANASSHASGSSSASSSASGSSSGVHHHIHHHYHHGSASSTSSAVTNSVVNTPHKASSTSSLKGKGKGKEASARHLSTTSSDFGSGPDDGFFNAAYHYRSGPLARKLSSALLSRDPSLTDLPLFGTSSSPNGSGIPSPATLSSGSHRRRSGWKSPRRKNTDLFSSDDAAYSYDASTPYRTRRRFSAFVPLTVQKGWARLLRHPLVPTQPLTILFALGLFACFAFSVTSFMYHILSNDKTPRPWRAYCQEQRPFPHELADSLAPVDVFVGVFSVDAAYERRHLIRSTYLRHSKPMDPYTGRPAHNVQVKFILGRPRKHHARRIALEMETYDDIVVLDMKENMNQGKTHAFFRWANENATVPIYYKPPQGKRIGRLDPSSSDVETLNAGFKKADYVVKADDDSFLVLSELERHLRVAPRQGAYWGYLIRNLFMGGECYALSADLVKYVATTPALEAYTTGAEDKRVAKWMRMHPNASSINWITERCNVYDHPKAATTYSHGFLFPDEVERVRAEGRTGISPAERTRRGGELADAWSTVSRWKQAYVKPKAEMTMEEEVEALVEGGGRWSALDGWTHKLSTKDVVRWDQVVFENADERIKGAPETARRADQARAEHNLQSETSFGKYNRMPNSLIRDADLSDIRPQNAKRSLAFWKRSDPSEADLLSDASPAADASDSLTNVTAGTKAGMDETIVEAEAEAKEVGGQIPIGSAPHFKQGYSFLPDWQVNLDTVKHKAIPAPTLRYDPSATSVRERRFLGLPYGGTVVVHYLKRNEWFLETALALLGREKMWDNGNDVPAYPAYVPRPAPGRPAAPVHDGQPSDAKDTTNISPVPTWNGKTGEIEMVASQWGGVRMYGSPLIKESGFVALGRTVPWDALQKVEDQKYGKLRASPRERYADMPQHASDQSADSALSSSSLLGSSSLASRSEQSSAASPASDASSTHEHLVTSSTLEQESSTHAHSHSSLVDDPTSASPAFKQPGSLRLQQPAGGQGVLSL